MRLSLKTGLAIFVLFLLFLWAIFPFLTPGLPNTHDGQTHVMRLASFHQALIDGQIPPRWAGNLVFGFGSPVLSFAFPLPYLLGEVFHRFGFSFIDSLKAVFILSVLFSGLTMFLFLSRLTSRLPAFLGTALYLLAPYRFIDLYVRGDVGESLVFVFPPLILWLLWDQEKINFTKITFAAFTVGAMLLSHQIMAVVFLAIIFILLLSRRRVLVFLISAVLGFLIAAFNLLPLIFEKRLVNLNWLILTNFQDQFPTLRSLLYSAWHWGPALPGSPEISMAFQLGIAQWLVIFLLVSCLIWHRRLFKETDYRLSVLVLVLFLGVLFLITSYSQFLWENISLLAMVLYPWRFLGVAVFLVAVMSALLIHQVKQNSIKIFLAIILVALAWYSNRNHVQVVGRTIHDDAFYLTFPGTSDMWGEFLPRNTELPQKPPDEKVEITKSEAKIEDLKVKSNEVSFKTTSEKEVQFLINIFSYPGWQVWVDEQKARFLPSRFLEFLVPAGEHEVKAKFTETPIRQISNYLSLGTLIFLLFLAANKLMKQR